MTILDIILNWVHVACAALFVGTMCFATFMLMPVLKVHIEMEQRKKLMENLVPRIRGIMRFVIVTLVLSGMARAALLHFTYSGPPNPLRLLLFGAKLAFAATPLAIFALAPRILGHGAKPLCCDPDAPGEIFGRAVSEVGERLHYAAIAGAALAAFLGVTLAHMH